MIDLLAGLRSFDSSLTNDEKRARTHNVPSRFGMLSPGAAAEMRDLMRKWRVQHQREATHLTEQAMEELEHNLDKAAREYARACCPDVPPEPPSSSSPSSASVPGPSPSLPLSSSSSSQ
jgi:hypothetical protein